MVTGPVGEAEDGVEADAAEAAGGPQAVTFGQVLGNGQGLIVGKLQAEEAPALFGEVLTAGEAAEAADVTGSRNSRGAEGSGPRWP